MQPRLPGGQTSVDGVQGVAGAVARLSRVTLAYAISALLASLSAVAMGFSADSMGSFFFALGAFVASGAVSAFVVTDLLEFLWDGVAGRGPASEGFWGATLALLLVGMISLGIGCVVSALALGLREEWRAFLPLGIALLGACGLLILLAVALPSLFLGSPEGRWITVVAAALGAPAVAAESAIAVIAPYGSNPWLGWMEGTFPLLNWNVVLGALVAASAFLLWWGYRSIPLPQDADAAAAGQSPGVT